MNLEIQKRKSTRLKGFDYTSSRFYFVTICTYDHRCLFGMIQETADNGIMVLNDRGKLIERHIIQIPTHYEEIRIDKFVVMPNHIHMIIELEKEGTVSLNAVVGLFKSGASKEAGFSLWQRSFHDHIIRSEEEYKKIWQYIDTNPAKWAMDKYHTV